MHLLTFGALVASSVLFLAGSAIANDKLTVVADEWPPFSGEALPSGGISLM